MSSNQRKGNSQRRGGGGNYYNNNSNNNNNNNSSNQQQNSKNQQQKRVRYQPKSSANTNNTRYNNNANSNNNSNNNSSSNANYRSPGNSNNVSGNTNNSGNSNQNNNKNPNSPKRFGNRGPSSPNNRSQPRSYNRSQQQAYTNTANEDYTMNANSGQRFKLKPANGPNSNYRSNQHMQHNNSSNNNGGNNSGNTMNSQGYTRRRNTNQNSNYADMDKQTTTNYPRGDHSPSTQSSNYPPPRYRPNETNNSERNRNWRNRAPDTSNHSNASANSTNPVPAEFSPRFRATSNSTNAQSTARSSPYDTSNNDGRYARSHHSHSRSPQNGPYNPASNAVANFSISGNSNNSNNSPAFQPHHSPINTYKAMNSPIVHGVNTPGSDEHSGPMTPVSYRRVNNAAATNTLNGAPPPQQATATTAGTLETTQEFNAATDIATVTLDAAGNGELFDVLYAQSGSEPTVAFPVIQLCLNPTIQAKEIAASKETDGGDVDLEETLSSELKQTRKYPVDWLLGVGKEIREPPSHPKDDIPEEVLFQKASHRWKQHRSTAHPAAAPPNLTTNSPIPTASSRFAAIHQLPPHQLAQTAANTVVPVNTTNVNNANSNTPAAGTADHEERSMNQSWRNKANKQENSQHDKNSQDDDDVDNNDDDKKNAEGNQANANPTDEAEDEGLGHNERNKQSSLNEEGDVKTPNNVTDDVDDVINMDEIDKMLFNESADQDQDKDGDSQSPSKSNRRTAMVQVSSNEAPKKMPMNGAVSMEDFEQQLRAQQQQRQKTNSEQKPDEEPGSLDNQDDSNQADNSGGNDDAEKQQNERENGDQEDIDNVTANGAEQADGDDNDEDNDSNIDLDQFQAIHHTPELKPDPREMVDEDPNVAPAWAEDNEDEDPQTYAQDFQFGVLDKQRDRQQLKETGALTKEAPTISGEEYQRRKQMEEKQRRREEAMQYGSQQYPYTQQQQDAYMQQYGHHPTRPPMPHGAQQPGYDANMYPPPHGQQYGGQRAQHYAQDQPPLQGDGQMPPANPADQLPMDQLPARIRGIVVRLDEDIQKISSYIRQVTLEPDQLNRYKRHLQKLIDRRRQYANWWRAQQKKAGENETTDTQANPAQTEGNGGNTKPNPVSVGLLHTQSLQQLEHYKDYYNKQLKKMIDSASNDPKFHTYVEYYRQKLKAVEKRQRELESRNKPNTPRFPNLLGEFGFLLLFWLLLPLLFVLPLTLLLLPGLR